ncbi:ketopantoate reductase family protein [Aquibacillus rhizosphaerae]|uniref:2-dehydropantoate 2-reductase n=1 Tax=Aquibacillus rhizosphaerae TaxID=3051431 RepID=A0ABT7L1N0_9BACI|nr:2-dehydropantoate 2-reductase [Aquibacillus sp. LR5S19]MDL4839284.1 2-dehydropantoate 2-reductase [Aquibacillus sp. LR5S19]
MKIVVLGAGALGAYFGARWQQSNQDVTFLVRPKRAEQLRQNGIIIHSIEGDYAIKQPQVVTDTSEIEACDLVLLAIKGYHLSGVLDDLENLVAKGAKVLPILNGIEHFSLLQSKLGNEAVLGGLSFIISTLNQEGDVVHSSPFHDLLVGALHPSQVELCEQIEFLSHNANMNVINSPNIQTHLWKKYMFITAFSGITTATNLAIGSIRDQPATFRIAENLVKDMRKLANANDIALNDKHVSKAIENMQKLGDEATSSMHQDRRRQQGLEVEHLHGGALRLAKEKNIDLPFVETIYGIIKPFENLNYDRTKETN